MVFPAGAKFPSRTSPLGNPFPCLVSAPRAHDGCQRPQPLEACHFFSPFFFLRPEGGRGSIDKLIPLSPDSILGTLIADVGELKNSVTRYSKSKQPMSTQKLPQIDSIQELARFWDTHDLTTFEDELEEVSESVFEGRTVIPLHLQSGEAQALHQIATAKGIADEDVVREWVLEKLRAG